MINLSQASDDPATDPYPEVPLDHQQVAAAAKGGRPCSVKGMIHIVMLPLEFTQGSRATVPRSRTGRRVTDAWP